MLNKSNLKKAIAVVVALAVVAASFTAGFFTHKLSRGSAVDTYEWALEQIEKYYYSGGVEDGFTQTAIEAIADKYLDRYSAFYSAEEYDLLMKSNAGAKVGIGITYSFVKDRGIFVGSVLGNSPAYKSGLRDGAWLSCGVTSGGEKTQFDSASDFVAFLDPIAEGENFTLVSIDGTGYTMAKAQYTASYTYMSTNSSSWIFSDAASGGLSLYERTDEAIPCLPDGTAYIRLTQFYGTAYSEFFKLIEKFNATGCTSLILDLRSNGGGYVSVMQYIAGAFADGKSQTAMIARYKDGKEEVAKCAEVSDPALLVSKQTKVYVLANSGTASASEALIGAMICYGALEYENIFLSDYSSDYIEWLEESGQEVKTAQTFGKGIMQSTFVNESTGDALKLTTAQVYWPDGKTCIHGVGLTVADGCTPVSAEWTRTQPDDELERVVEIIKSR